MGGEGVVGLNRMLLREKTARIVSPIPLVPALTASLKSIM